MPDRISLGEGWLYVVGGLIAFAVAILNSFVHSRDAWKSVMPLGLGFSVITVLLVLIVAVLGARFWLKLTKPR